MRKLDNSSSKKKKQDGVTVGDYRWHIRHDPCPASCDEHYQHVDEAVDDVHHVASRRKLKGGGLSHGAAPRLGLNGNTPESAALCNLTHSPLHHHHHPLLTAVR